MPRGGHREGAGRKAGAVITKSREVADKLVAEGLTPLDYLVGVMRQTMEYHETRFEAAKAAAPYMHARLAAVEMNATIKRDATDLSDAELAAIAAGGRELLAEAPPSSRGPDRVH